MPSPAKVKKARIHLRVTTDNSINGRWLLDIYPYSLPCFSMAEKEDAVL